MPKKKRASLVAKPHFRPVQNTKPQHHDPHASHQTHHKPQKHGNGRPKSPEPDRIDPHDPRANIPFDFTSDSILLVGDGDLSFARSLACHHVACSLTATTFDSATDLTAKYPQSTANIAAMRADDPDGTATTILHGVDATRLAATKALKGPHFDRIVFNFPHVGGKSTDVNRQVRANQELLVGFFGSARPLLRPGGDATLLVALFEGEPYTLWNVRDLARHAGLEVRRSFRFEAARYPGYAHARTLGVVEGGGGWKGEEREARMYVFGAKREGVEREGRGGKKRKRSGDSSDEDG